MSLSGPILEDLRNAYAARSLIVFAGAGISKAAGLPGWLGLAQMLRDRIHAENGRPDVISELDDLILRRQLVDAMSAAKHAIGDREFYAAVTKALDDSALELPDVVTALADLKPDLRAVLTTNLDHLLERALQWPTFSDPPGDLAQQSHYVWKLHGTLRDVRTWVFTRDEYDAATFGRPSLRATFEGLFQGQHILFVGYGLEDDDLDQALAKTRALAGPQPPAHFALLQNPIPQYRRMKLERAGLRLLEYDRHDELPGILRSISTKEQPKVPAAGVALQNGGNESGNGVLNLTRDQDRMLAELKAGIGALTHELIRELDLITGYEPLPLDHIRRLPTTLLIAGFGVIPYADFRGLRANLLAWARDESLTGAAGRLYAAPGGYGKTHLALQAITELAADGWRAGILRRDALAKTDFHGEQHGDGRLERFFRDRGAAGAFLVLDYAENRAGDIERVTRAALHAPGDGPVRIVLLARSAGDWWSDLLRESRDIERVFDRNPMSAMWGDIDPNFRNDFFTRAASAFAVALGAAQSEDDRLLSNEWTGRPIPATRLAADAIGSPLSIAIEAFLHVRGINARDSPLAELAREERCHWRRALKVKAGGIALMSEPTVDAVHRGAAVLTLIQGTSPASAADTDDILDRVLRIAFTHATLPRDDIARSHIYADVRRALDVLYRNRGVGSDALRPVLPDLLGEHVAGEALAQKNRRLLGPIFDILPQEGTRAFDVLARMRSPIHGEEIRLAVDIALQREFATPGTIAAYRKALFDACESDPYGLEDTLIPVVADLNPLEIDEFLGPELAVRRAAKFSRLRNMIGLLPSMMESVVSPEQGREAFGRLPYEARIRTARALYVRAILLKDAGRYQESLSLIERAIELAAPEAGGARSGEFDAVLLEGRSVLLEALGRRDEAISSSEAAIRIYRALQVTGQKADPGLLDTTVHLAALLASARRAEESVHLIEEALLVSGIPVKDTGPGVGPEENSAIEFSSADAIAGFTHVVVEALFVYSELHQAEKGIPLFQRTRLAFDELYRKRPDHYTSDFAAFLTNAGNLYGTSGDQEEALGLLTKTMDVYRIAAETDLLGFGDRYASSICNVAAQQLQMGAPEDAERTARAAIEQCLILRDKGSQGFLAPLAKAFAIWGDCPASVGDHAKSANVFSAAISMLNEHTREFGGQFVRTYTYIASRLIYELREIGQMERALELQRQMEALEEEANVAEGENPATTHRTSPPSGESL